MSFVEQYLLQLNTEKRRGRRTVIILSALSLLVALVTVWNLRMIGVAVANDATCGYVEHQHTEKCPVEKTLICGYVSIGDISNEGTQTDSPAEMKTDSPETTDITETTDIADGTEISRKKDSTAAPTSSQLKETDHVHTDACYETVYLCGVTEHVHAVSCYSDPTADVETALDWELTIPQDLGEYWSENIARIAVSQIGVSESEQNYIIADDGETRQGITRYGQWYGNPYSDWSAMFVSFCLHYAEIPTDAIPQSPGVYNMMRLCEDAQILFQPDKYIGTNGNILFLDTDGNGNADKMLIVTALEDASAEEEIIYAVGGDWNNTVAEVPIRKDDPALIGYVPTAAVREAYLQSTAVYSINKNNNVYTINVYALPVDYAGNRINELPVTELETIRVNSTTKISVANRFDYNLGIYHSAYFGTETSVSVDRINTVWRYKSGNTYYLAYAQTNNTQNQSWKSRTDTSISLYLRYTPEFSVTFQSEGFETVMEYLEYKGYPTLTEPSEWSREGYILTGWLASDNQTVYSYEELLERPVTENVTYTAQWRRNVTIYFDLGQHSDSLYPIDPLDISYGSKTLLPTPGWKNNAVAMAFDGWYLNRDLTQKITSDYVFYENTTLYAKWSPKEDGYYVYFMDFLREGQTPLVLMTYSVTENQTASPYTPGNEPEGTQWDGNWYLENSCANLYNFSIPVSQMTAYLTGSSGRDLYLYPGTQDVCRAIFVTYGTKVDPVTIPVGGSIDLDQYKPERQGYEFAGWTLQDGTPVSGKQTLNKTTTFVAKWNAGYVSFEAILRIENANDTGMTQADILGTWYAKAGSHIRVKSTYNGSGNNRTATHQVVCVIDGVEYPVYKNSALTQQATLNDVYSTYFIYNNTGTAWTDEVNWDEIYTGGEVPYSTRPVSSAGDTIINFDYMRVRNDIVFTIGNSSSGAYIDVFRLYRDGLITGSVTYTGTRPTTTGRNVSATGVSADNIRWSYTAANSIGTNQNNYYTLHDMKYGQRIYEVYPVGGSWLTPRDNAFHWYLTGNSQKFSSRREDLSSDFFSGSGRKLTPYSLTAVFDDQDKIALMYAVECLPGEKADFTIDNIGYKVQSQLCEVVNHSGDFSQKELLGCVKESSASYTNLNTTSSKLGGTSVKTLFGTTYWKYYNIYDGVASLSDIDKAYIFYYTRLHMNIQFNFGYDSNGDGTNETTKYENIAYGEKIGEYQFGMPNYGEHTLLTRTGYEFAGWLDANGYVLEAEDWESIVATGDSENNTMIFIAKWEKISNNVVEYYEDRSSANPFETHYFDDGELLQYPTMTVYPQGWVWQEYGEGQFQRFDWDVPMYGEYGVQETRTVNGEKVVVNVIRIYGTWDESHTKVVYDPNAPQGGIPGTAPTDGNEYTIWQSEVPVASQEETSNSDPDLFFVGWLLDRNGIVYQPGDHVPVRWPRTMIFTAQWAKTEDVVYLRYDPNGGTPIDVYPNATGFPYKKNATAAVWNNTRPDGSVWFSRNGYIFIGWNTAPDGSGTAYAPDTSITLTNSVTTLYAQWKKTSYSLSVNKVALDNNEVLPGAEFGLYREENGVFVLVQTFTTGMDGNVTFLNLEKDTLYKLVEEKPPNGYAIITKEIFFALQPKGSTESLQFYDSAGNMISAPNGVSGVYNTGNQFLTVTVENLRGYELPSTGGVGTLFYILCGLTLVLSPLVYGLSLKYKSKRKSKN